MNQTYEKVLLVLAGMGIMGLVLKLIEAI